MTTVDEQGGSGRVVGEREPARGGVVATTRQVDGLLSCVEDELTDGAACGGVGVDTCVAVVVMPGELGEQQPGVAQIARVLDGVFRPLVKYTCVDPSDRIGVPVAAAGVQTTGRAEMTATASDPNERR